MKVLIKITKDVLIKTSQCKMDVGLNCAVSFAIREILPHAWVSRYHIFPFHKRGSDYSEPDNFSNIPLPIEAVCFIRDFDSNNQDKRIEMNPTSFEIDVPNWVIDLIGINEVYKVLSESRTLELVHP